MASNTTSSIYGSSGSNRMGGLMSGLDTETLVKQMVSGTQNKINKQFQAQQKLVYKQDAYRDVISKLVSFNDKYLSYASSTNILSPNFFKANTFTPTSKNVNVSGNAESIKNFEINKIHTVATNTRFSSNNKISDGTFSSDVLIDEKYVSTLANQAMTIKCGDETFTIKIDSEFSGATADEVNLEAVRDKLNEKLSENDLADKLNYSIVDGKLKLNKDPDDSTELKVVAVGKGIEDILKIKLNSDGSSAEDEDIIADELFKHKTLPNTFKEGTITFDYNGVRKTLSFSDTNITDAVGLKNELQTQLNRAFGENNVLVTEENGAIKFEVKENNVFGISDISSDITLLTGMKAGDNNRTDLAQSISKLVGDNPAKDEYEIEINGIELSFSKDASIADVVNKINTDSRFGITLTYSKTTDSFTAVSKETGAHTKNLLNIEAGDLANALFGQKGINYDIQEGTDAELEVTMNGTKSTIIRSTNSFTLDDITLDLSSKAAGEENISFSVSNNVDEVVDKVAKFIEEYNAIISYLDEKIMETPNRKYPPLTNEQRNEMKENDIKSWDEKSKAGVLFADSNMQAVLTDLRNAMSGFVEGANMMLADVGITHPTGDISGKLAFDKEKFKAAYAEKPNEVALMFTQNKRNDNDEGLGLAVRVKNILTNNIGIAGEKGTLVEHSGTKGTTTVNENYLSKRIKEYEDTIINLNKKMEKERQRYWNQFVALEKALANMDSQASWLNNQFQ